LMVGLRSAPQINFCGTRAGGDSTSEVLDFWRRRRDSNPRYAFGAYNGLANRRLQPLGHVSASWKAYNVPTAGSNSRLIPVRRPILNDIEGFTADEPKTTPRHAQAWLAGKCAQLRPGRRPDQQAIF